jgi:hypothetical protein
MKPKYEKPMIKDLGEGLPKAAGNCNTGSVVGSAPPVCAVGGGGATSGQCKPGSRASGNCNNGGVAQ